MVDAFVKQILDLVSKDEMSEENAFNLIKAHNARVNANSINNEIDREEDIAIIGVACRFPKADNKEEYWDNLINEVDCITKFPTSRIELVREYLDNNKTLALAGYLENIEMFDADFFNILPGEAKMMDPQQRLFMEVGYEVFEDAGYGGKRFRDSRTGIFVGFSEPRYKKFISENSATSFLGNFPAAIASRIAYAFNLSGPAMSIATACSSSLVALHTACSSLKANDCEMALVGGVVIEPLVEQCESDGLRISSRDGKSKSFDESADGTGWGEGCGCVLLKPLKNALKDNDNIYAVVKGSAINQDGTSNGFASPNALAQEEVIIKAWNNAKVDPLSISLIEAHGTGTKIGDPIEIRGLSNAFRRYTSNCQICALGSVKSNIGHLDSASGMAGLIKVILALKNQEIPPTLNFNCPNSLMNLHSSPLYINNQVTRWERYNNMPLRAGVSSFGLSGTNCHVVLEEYISHNRRREDAQRGWILTVSAKTKRSLIQLSEKYIKFLKEKNKCTIEEICYISNTGREHWENRLAICVFSKEELIEKLNLIYFRMLTNEWASIIEKGIFLSDNKYDDLTLNKKNETSINQTQHKKRMIKDAIDYVQFEDIEWLYYYPNPCRKVAIPTYAWDKKRHWVDDARLNRLDKFKSSVSNLSVENYNNSSIIDVDVEEELKNIWSNVLGIQDISNEDNFFELGGDSILATDLVNYIMKYFEIQMNIADVFEYGTIKEQCWLVEKSHKANNSDILVAKNSDYYPISSGQKRQFILNQISKESLGYNMPCVGIIEGNIKLGQFNDVFNQLIRRHDSFRTIFDIIDNNIVQKILPEVYFKVEYSEINEGNIGTKLHEFIRPFDLGKAPLLRVGLFKIKNDQYKAERHLFIMDMHHIISDGGSMEVLIKELSLLISGQVLPINEYQYKDYCIWQKEEFQSERMKAHEDYWMRSLLGSNKKGFKYLNLPTDFLRPLIMTFEGSIYRFSIDKTTVEKLKSLGVENGATLYMTLLAVYYVLLYYYTEQKEIVIGLLISDRRHNEFANIIGLFTNYLPIKINVDGNYQFSELLKVVKENTIEAYAHQDYPFEKMVEKLGLNRDASRNPIFNTMLILHNQGVQNSQYQLNDLNLKMLNWNKSSATLDLKLDFHQNSDGGLNCAIEYYTRVFQENTIKKLAIHYKGFIEEILENNTIKIIDYNVLSEEDSESLKSKRKMKQQGYKLPPIQQTLHDGVSLASYYQKCIWDSKSYNNYITVIKLRGHVKEKEFKDILYLLQKDYNNNSLIRFAEKGNELYQFVSPEINSGFEIIDIRNQANKYEIINEIVKKEKSKDFRNNNCSQLQVRLYQYDEEYCYLIVTVSPMLIECFNIDYFLMQLEQLYKYRANLINYKQYNTNSSRSKDFKMLETPNVSVIDFSNWQRQIVEGGYLEVEKNHWLEIFKKPIPKIIRKIEAEPVKNICMRNEKVQLEFSKDIVNCLREYAEFNKTGIYEVLLTSYYLLLSQLMQTQEILIYTHRNYKSKVVCNEDVININIPALIRIKSEKQMAFNSLLQMVSEKIQQSDRSKLYPYCSLDEYNLNVNKEDFEQLFSVQFSEVVWVDTLFNCKTEEITTYCSEQFLIKLSFVMKEGGICLEFKYDQRAFELEDIRTMAKRYEKIIKIIVSNVKTNLNSK